MRFGIFDHLDDGGVPLGQLFEERLELIEAYDRAGFYGYHLAEHHATPLGYAPSPGVFLSAGSGPSNCASGRWFTCCRSTIRCG
jgi:alkanesulfonate monooxygenase SsuD/methylene tetrahydromethanopterin reductase-like flavin-dependent oxidoreductase (luciferase family)